MYSIKNNLESWKEFINEMLEPEIRKYLLKSVYLFSKYYKGINDKISSFIINFWFQCLLLLNLCSKYDIIKFKETATDKVNSWLEKLYEYCNQDSDEESEDEESNTNSDDTE